jgi:type II secretory pathway component PulF
MFWFLKNNLCDSPLYEAFLSTGFLIRYGVNASVAVGLGASILGLDSKPGQIFLKARQQMEGGIELVKAFCSEKCGSGFVDSEIQEAFYYAQKSGGKNEVFERVARMLGRRLERKTTFLLSLVEPLFVGGIGIFLIILMANFLMPVMNGLNLM